MTEIGTTTRLSIDRTVMAANRTLMAWIRTAMSMISFGFTIYKVIQGLQDGTVALPIDLHAARAGMLLTGLGILCLIVGIVEYYLILRQMRKLMPINHWRYPLVVAVLMLLVAMAIFISILAGVI